MKKFIRTIEDFVCTNCGQATAGNGYTNHCPACLWSRHADVNPGDRNSECKGLMKPIAAEVSGDGYIIIHKCEGCGKVARVRAVDDDNVDEIIKLSNHPEFIFGKK